MSEAEENGDAWPKKRHKPIPIKSDVINDVDQSSCNENVEQLIDNTIDNTVTHTNRMETMEESDDSKGHIRSRSRLCCCSCYIPRRYIITFLLGFAQLLVYAMRTNIGVTVVMILDEAPHEKVKTLDVFFKLPRVGWDSRMVGFLHSAFYIGYIVTQLPGAFLTTLWPCHRLFGLCILSSALLNLLLPICIQNDQYVLTCTVRLCQGLAEGLFYPSCYGVLRHWSAPRERSRTISIVLTSGFAGAILGFPIGGFITHSFGWEYVFYVCGGAICLWYLFWALLAYEKPSHCSSISEEEYEYLEKSQGQDVIDYENAPVPWRDILTSLPVIAICFCHFARHWLFILMLTNEPLYLNEFGFNIAQTGLYASIPHIAMVVFSFGSGVIADMLLNTNCLSTTTTRKLLTGIGFLGPSVCFLVLTLLYDGVVVIVVLTVALGAFGLSTSGWSVNHYDLSTRHASSLVALSSSFGTIGAILVPLVVGDFTVHQDLQGWDNVFYTTTGVLTFSGLFYLIFASGEQQRWANPNPELNLVQKVDPLARKPYKLQTLAKQTSITDDKSNNATDKTLLVTSKYGHGYGVNTDTLNTQLTESLEKR